MGEKIPPPPMRRRSSTTSSAMEKASNAKSSLLPSANNSPSRSSSRSPTPHPQPLPSIPSSKVPSKRRTKRILKRGTLALFTVLVFTATVLSFLPKAREKIKTYLFPQKIAGVIKIKGLSEEEALDKAVEAVLGDVERNEVWKSGGGRVGSAFAGVRMLGTLDPWMVPEFSAEGTWNTSEIIVEESIDEPVNDEDADYEEGSDLSERHAVELSAAAGFKSHPAPIGTPRQHKTRLIIIGDIHGMFIPLKALLTKLDHNPDTDHIITTGDMVNKGPSSSQVVGHLMSLNASAVRGNHEDRILLAWKGMQRKALALQPTAAMSKHPLPRSDPAAKIPEPTSEDDDALDVLLANTDTFTRSKESRDRLLAKKLGAEKIAWLESHPVILKVGKIKGLGEVVVVHGGLVPGVPLERQDAYAVMNMRTLDLRTRVPSERHKGVNWCKVWNRLMRRIVADSFGDSSDAQADAVSGEAGGEVEEMKKGKNGKGGVLEPMTVLYGHDSRRGLRIGQWTKGMDSGCVGGGRLSAYVIESEGGKVKTKVVSVSCKGRK